MHRRTFLQTLGAAAFAGAPELAAPGLPRKQAFFGLREEMTHGA